MTRPPTTSEHAARTPAANLLAPAASTPITVAQDARTTQPRAKSPARRRAQLAIPHRPGAHRPIPPAASSNGPAP